MSCNSASRSPRPTTKCRCALQSPSKTAQQNTPPSDRGHQVYWDEWTSPEGAFWPDGKHVFWCRWSVAESLAKELAANIAEALQNAVRRQQTVTRRVCMQTCLLTHAHAPTRAQKKHGDAEPEPGPTLSKKWGSDKGDPVELSKRIQEARGATFFCTCRLVDLGCLSLQLELPGWLAVLASLQRVARAQLGDYLQQLRDWGEGLPENTAMWDWVRLTGPVKGFWTQKDASGKVCRPPASTLMEVRSYSERASAHT
jgi:hypothetical protein